MHSPSHTVAHRIGSVQWNYLPKSPEGNIQQNPSVRIVRSIVDQLMQVVLLRDLPDTIETKEDLREHIATLIADIRKNLAEQIMREKHGKRPSTKTAEAILDALPSIIRLVHGDIEAALAHDPAARNDRDYVRLTYPGVLAIAIYRIAHEIHDRGFRTIARIMSEYAHERTGIDIHPGARIGKRFFIDHGTGVVVGETAEIDDDVSVYQGVTLGATSFPKKANGTFDRKKRRHPKLRKGVTVYANAVILGPHTVGAGSTIGANAHVVLTKDLPRHTRIRPEHNNHVKSGKPTKTSPSTA